MIPSKEEKDRSDDDGRPRSVLRVAGIAPLRAPAFDTAAGNRVEEFEVPAPHRPVLKETPVLLDDVVGDVEVPVPGDAQSREEIVGLIAAEENVPPRFVGTIGNEVMAHNGKEGKEEGGEDRRLQITGARHRHRLAAEGMLVFCPRITCTFSLA